ncbi:Cysteine protease atg4 [Bachmanniomyces sp. S44760]|nr:Cysteine protease atg4 [Bachmanniomyces sp. S44760]
MANVDRSRYKRLVQYFWDPEPRNERVMAPIWCLGRKYSSYEDQVEIANSEGQFSSVEKSSVTDESTAGLTTQQVFENVEGHRQEQIDDPKIQRQMEEAPWPTSFMDDFKSRIRFTYRSDFPLIKKSSNPNATADMSLSVRLFSQITNPEGFTSDTGWGCMIRSGQSLLANALAILRLGRGWRQGLEPERERRLLSLFADDPNAPFSLHNFVEHGATACGKHPGQWFGPSATARCIEALSEENISSELKVYITGDGPDVFEDAIFRLALGKDGFFKPVLILIGIRLGIDHITPIYWDALKKTLQLPQSVGIAGGRPSSSHYFVGVQEEDFFYLDPHQTQKAFPLHKDLSQYSMADIDTLHAEKLHRLNLKDMDPSMLIGYLIRDEDDWRDWRRRITMTQGKSIVNIADTETIYRGQSQERASALDEVETFDEDEDTFS